VAGREVLQIRVVIDEGGGVRQRREPKGGRRRVFVGVLGEGEGGDGVYPWLPVRSNRVTSLTRSSNSARGVLICTAERKQKKQPHIPID
jgi:hypothetical protein